MVITQAVGVACEVEAAIVALAVFLFDRATVALAVLLLAWTLAR